MDEAMDDAMDDAMASDGPTGARWWPMVARRALSPSDPAVLAAGTALMALLAYLPTSLRWLNLPLVLLWPGQCARVAIFGRRPRSHLSAAVAPATAAAPSPSPSLPALGLNLILTLVLVPLVSLAIASTGLRLTHHTVTVGLSVTMLVFAGFEFVRRSRNPVEPSEESIARTESGSSVSVRSWLVARGIPTASVSIAAMIVVALATVVLLPRPDSGGFTQFAFDGPWALARSVISMPTDSDVNVAFRVTNLSGRSDTYTVDARVVGEDGTTLKRWEPVRRDLADGTSWQGVVSGSIDPTACDQRIELSLRSISPPRASGMPQSDSDGVEPVVRWGDLTVAVAPVSKDCADAG